MEGSLLNLVVKGDHREGGMVRIWRYFVLTTRGDVPSPRQPPLLFEIAPLSAGLFHSGSGKGKGKGKAGILIPTVLELHQHFPFSISSDAFS
jgi:hypothetical protein